MMLMSKPKMAQTIVAGVEKLPEAPKESDMAIETAATKLMSALEAKDTKSFVASLKELMSLCESEED